MCRYLFAYGTLRKSFGLTTELEYIGSGRINGRMYDLGEYPGAVPAETGEIIGEVFRSPQDLAALDEYEGPEFVRKTGPVKMESGVVQAWIYWYIGDVAGRSPIEENDYLNYLKSIKPK